jgi:hypothetical protein
VTGTTYCLNDPIIITSDIRDVRPLVSGVCSNYNGIVGYPPAIFKRQVKLTTQGTPTANLVNIDITVEWIEGGITYTVPLSTTFSIWE